MSDKQQIAPYPLRMPEEMRDHLKDAAHRNHRSLNAEIVARLLTSIERESFFDKEAEGEVDSSRKFDSFIEDLEELKRSAIKLKESRLVQLAEDGKSKRSKKALKASDSDLADD